MQRKHTLPKCSFQFMIARCMNSLQGPNKSCGYQPQLMGFVNIRTISQFLGVISHKIDLLRILSCSLYNINSFTSNGLICCHAKYNFPSQDQEIIITTTIPPKTWLREEQWNDKIWQPSLSHMSSQVNMHQIISPLLLQFGRICVHKKKWWSYQHYITPLKLIWVGTKKDHPELTKPLT